MGGGAVEGAERNNGLNYNYCQCQHNIVTSFDHSRPVDAAVTVARIPSISTMSTERTEH